MAGKLVALGAGVAVDLAGSRSPGPDGIRSVSLRTVAGSASNSSRICAATPEFSEISPSRMCSVPMVLAIAVIAFPGDVPGLVLPSGGQHVMHSMTAMP